MKRKSSSRISPWSFLIPLIIALAVVAGATVFAQLTTENRSKASYDPTKACVQACNKAGTWVKDAAACALDCPSVISGTMSCTSFCKENVRQASRTNNQGEEKTSMGVCTATCNKFTNPCSTVCNGAGKYAASCNTQCNAVDEGQKTCAEAFSQAAFPGVGKKYIQLYQKRCEARFGDTLQPKPTGGASPTPETTPVSINCTGVCQGLPAAVSARCATICMQFNAGQRSCPSGCNNTGSYQQQCMQAFCSQ